jgi:heterotetrameric sarcosine oxidase delta subunit
MRILCPHCGDRPIDEFVPSGAAPGKRPETSTEMADWVDYVYLRDNVAGQHRELFYHVSGCRTWLIVTRDTRSHAVGATVAARDQRYEPAR